MSPHHRPDGKIHPQDVWVFEKQKTIFEKTGTIKKMSRRSWEWYNHQRWEVQLLIPALITVFVAMPLASLISKILGYGW